MCFCQVCQTTNPVGQMAEYLSDDIEAMQKFLENCKAEYFFLPTIFVQREKQSYTNIFDAV